MCKKVSSREKNWIPTLFRRQLELYSLCFGHAQKRVWVLHWVMTSCQEVPNHASLFHGRVVITTLLPSQQMWRNWNFQFVTCPTCNRWWCFTHISHITDLYDILNAVIYIYIYFVKLWLFSRLLFQGWFTNDIPWSWSFKCFEGR